MIVRPDTRREAIRAMWRQRDQCRKKGSQSRVLMHGVNIDPEEEVIAINRRIRFVIKSIRDDEK